MGDQEEVLYPDFIHHRDGIVMTSIWRTNNPCEVRSQCGNRWKSSILTLYNTGM